MEGDTEATKTRLGTCERGLGSYKDSRAVRPVNTPLFMAVIWLPYNSLSKRGMSKHNDTRMMRCDGCDQACRYTESGKVK